MIKESAIDKKIEDVNKNIIRLKKIIAKVKTIDIKKYLEKVKKQSKTIKKSTGSKVNTFYMNNYNKKIGIVCDEFIWNTYKNTGKFVYLSPFNYMNKEVDVVLIVSTWKGVDLKWRGLGSKGPKSTEAMFSLIDFYKEKEVPVVFFSKEDPTNYERFIHIAKECDYVLTTCVEVMPDYIKDCHHDRVFLWGFSIDPTVHNPIDLSVKETDSIIFSGSWYEKYPKRCEDMTMLFNGVINTHEEKFVIIDRNYELKLPEHTFPQTFSEHITTALPHNELTNISRAFEYSININTVQYSNTMFATRVYENLASGLITLSNYSMGINNQFPTVKLFNEEQDLTGFLKNLSAKEKREIQIDGIRDVMTNYTNIHRIFELNNILFNDELTCNPTVLIIYPNAKKSNNIKQRYRNISVKFENQLEYSDIVGTQITMYFNEEMESNPNYVTDFVNGFRYTNSDVILRSNTVAFKYIKEINIDFKQGTTAIWNEGIESKEELLNEKAFNKYIENKQMFAIQETVPSQKKLVKATNYNLSVIIPVYNNGYILKHKAFSSLKKSDMFKKMEIILIDDGSTDEGYTKSIIRELDNNYANVKLYEYSDGGSGSASRPRNKGIKLATCKYVTYLDPDNEACYPGHQLLLEEAEDNDYDLVLGKMPRLADKTTVSDYGRNIRMFNKSTKKYVVGKENIRNLLFSSNMKAHSIQAMVIKKSVIETNNILMTEGAIGQDTVFCHELFCCINSISSIDENIHLYYAGVSGSAVNAINSSFFKKYLLLETERIEKYQHLGIFDYYIANRFEIYFEKWYLEKLKLTDDSNFEVSCKYIYEIYKLYKRNGFKEFETNKINKIVKKLEKEKYNKIMEMLK